MGFVFEKSISRILSVRLKFFFTDNSEFIGTRFCISLRRASAHNRVMKFFDAIYCAITKKF
nr:MAG TPA_asm: hypothetical protein [Caudoviricetes sp.]